MAQKLQKVQTKVVRCVEHGECGVAVDNQDLAVFLGIYFRARFNVVKNGHLSGAVSWLDMVNVHATLGFHMDFHKAV